MKYLLIMQINPQVLDALTEEERDAIGSGHQALLEEIEESGELIVTQALGDPAQSTVVAARGGVPAVTDGPYVEAKEYMGGYYLVDVEDKDRAIELAKKIPDTRFEGLAVEIRPVMFSSGSDL